MHQHLEDGLDIHSGSHIPPSHRPPDPSCVESLPVAQEIGVERVESNPSPRSPEKASALQSADSELSLLQSFFFCDAKPSDLSGGSREQTPAPVPDEGHPPASLLLGSMSQEMPPPKSLTLPSYQDDTELLLPSMETHSDASDNAAPQSQSTSGDDPDFSEDPWNFDIDISSTHERSEAECAPPAFSPTTLTIPAIVAGEAPLSDGTVIVEVDARLARLLNDPHHPVDAYVDAEDRLVITFPVTDPSPPISSRVSCLVQAVDPSATSIYESSESEMITSDIEDDALVSPVASDLSMTPLMDALGELNCTPCAH